MQNTNLNPQARDREQEEELEKKQHKSREKFLYFKHQTPGLKYAAAGSGAACGGLLYCGAGGLSIFAVGIGAGFSAIYAIRPILDGRAKPWCPMVSTILGYTFGVAMGAAGESLVLVIKIPATLGAGAYGLISLNPADKMKGTWNAFPDFGSTFMGCALGD